MQYGPAAGGWVCAVRACIKREGVSSAGLHQEGGCEQCGPAAGGREGVSSAGLQQFEGGRV